MPRRSRDKKGIFLPKTPTSPHSHPSLFFSDFQVEHTIGEPFENFEEPIGEEEEHVSLEELEPIKSFPLERHMGNLILRTSTPQPFHISIDLPLRTMTPSCLNFLLPVGPMTMPHMIKS